MRPRSLVLMILIGSVLVSCTTAPSLRERDAASGTTPRTGTPEPVSIDLTSMRGGATETTAPTAPTAPTALTSPKGEPSTSTGIGVVTTTVPEPRVVETTSAPAMTVPAIISPPSPAPVSPAPVSTAPVRPTPAPTAPVPPTPVPPTRLPPVSAPTVATTTTPTAVLDGACRQQDIGVQRPTNQGRTVICTRTNNQRRWVIVATTTTPASNVSNQPSIAPGFDGTTIRIGLLTTTTNPIWGPIGRAISAGIEARVAAINRNGGIGGQYRLVVVKAETNYDPTETLAQIQATKSSVIAYVSLLGTPSTEAAEPVLRGESILASPASQEARWSTAPTLLPVFNSYQVQAINGIAYFAEQFAVTNPGIRPLVCGVSVATSFGEAGSEGIRAAAQALPITLGPIVSIAPTESAFASAVGTLKGSGCQATFLTVGPAQTLGLVLTGRQLAFSNRWIIMGASFSDRIVTPLTGPLFEQGAWVVGDGTQWGDETVSGMVQMKVELLASDNRYWTENPDVGLSYGWAQARTIEQVLEAAVRRNDLSRVGLLTASQSMGPVDLGGIGSPIDYSQPVRLANARTTIFNVDNSYRNALRVLARDYSSTAAAAYRR